MPYTNIASEDLVPVPGPNFVPVKMLNVWETSATRHNQGINIMSDTFNVKWTSKGRGESIFIDVGTELLTINRMLIEWDPSLSRTGAFKVEFIVSPAVPPAQETKGKEYEGVQDTSLFTLIEDEDTGAKARAVRIICYGNDGINADDNNGISRVKFWSAT